MILGCGGPPAEVVGRVSGIAKSQGKPLAGCSVQFSDESRGIFVVCLIDEEGRYEAATAKYRGLSVGTYVVTLLTRRMPALDDPNQNRFPMPKPGDPPMFPEKYLNPKTSGLTLKVQESDQTFNIDAKP